MGKIINSFPGYEYVPYGDDGKPHNMYRGVDVGFGGYVYASPGMYTNVALLDIASMHPTSTILLNKLGEYTERYKALKDARVYIKHHDYESAGKLFDGKLKKYLTSDEEADILSVALKYPINQLYGISFTKYPNPARDPRDKNNIIALRGALFMKTLQDEISSRGFTVAHIKTDSIKIPEATPEIIDFVFEFGRKYGYEFEHECTYERFCLVNDAVYIAKYDDQGVRNKGGKHASKWTATGAQFQHPYIFKTLFSDETITFDDICETKNVSKGAIYLDFNEDLPDVSWEEKELKKVLKSTPEDMAAINGLTKEIEKGHNYNFVGKVGLFTPVLEGAGGGLLVSSNDRVKYDAVTGTKGFRWLESGTVKNLGIEDRVDYGYFDKLCNDAISNINHRGDAKGPDYNDFDIFVHADHETLANHLRDIEFSGQMEEPTEIPF